MIVFNRQFRQRSNVEPVAASRRPGFLKCVDQLESLFERLDLKRASSIRVAARVGELTQLNQQILNLSEFQFVAPQQQPVVLEVGVDPERVIIGFLLLSATAATESSKFVIEKTSTLRVLFLLDLGPQHESDGTCDVVGVVFTQRDDVKVPAAAIQLLDEHFDDDVVGPRAADDQSSLAGVDLNPRSRRDATELFKDREKCLRVETGQTVDLRLRDGTQSRIRNTGSLVDDLNGFCDECHLVRRSVHENLVVPYVGDDVDFLSRLLSLASPSGSGLSGLHHLLLLLHHLLHHRRVHHPASVARADGFAQQSLELIDDVLRPDVLQRERADETLVVLARLFIANDVANFTQVDDRVHRLQAVRSRERDELAVWTFHRGQFFNGIRSEHRLQSEGDFHKLMVEPNVELVFRDSRNERRVDRRDFSNRHHLAVDQNREPSRQQVTVQNVSNFRDGIPSRRDDVDVAFGQFVPVEACYRDSLQPSQDVRPGQVWPLKLRLSFPSVPGSARSSRGSAAVSGFSGRTMNSGTGFLFSSGLLAPAGCWPVGGCTGCGCPGCI